MIAAPKARRVPARRAKKLPPWKRNPEKYCSEPRCHRPRRAILRCATHAVRELDSLWSRLVKAKGICELADSHPTFPCSGILNAAHGFSRRYAGTRHILLNGFAICGAAHTYWTHRPLEWDVILRERWGESVYEELRRLALKAGRPDYELTFSDLVEEA